MSCLPASEQELPPLGLLLVAQSQRRHCLRAVNASCLLDLLNDTLKRLPSALKLYRPMLPQEVLVLAPSGPLGGPKKTARTEANNSAAGRIRPGFHLVFKHVKNLAIASGHPNGAQ